MIYHWKGNFVLELKTENDLIKSHFVLKQCHFTDMQLSV